MGKDKNLESFIEESISNIREDRDMVKYLLTDLLTEIKKAGHSHKEIGLIAAKYVETLQRSNEQLVKITALLHKQTSKQEDISLSNKDKDELFDLIQGNGNG